MSTLERAFLVCYDYGQGALWWWITAPSAADILRIYRNIEVLDDPPSWWTKDNDQLAPRLQLGDNSPGLEKAE